MKRSSARRWLFAARTGNRDANHAPITKALAALRLFFVDCSGVGNGVFDLLVYDRLNNPRWVELKTPKGKLNTAQRAFAAQLDARGVSWACCRSLDEVLALVAPSPRQVAARRAADAERAIAAELERMGHERG